MCDHEGHRHHHHGGECNRGHEEHEQDCGCGGHHSHHDGRCCCHGEGEPGPGFRRHFHTREERIAELERYLQDLRAEAQGVEERIRELKAAQ